MFQVDDLVVYGSTGVCRVQAIEPLKKGSKPYYTLQPVFGTEVIYTPVDTQVFMRPALTREQAQKFIEEIPGIKEDVCPRKNFAMVKEYYQNSFDSHECVDLVQLIKGIYHKSQKGKLGMVDQRYMKRAEDLLYGELAVALGIERDDVISYIRRVAGEEK